MRIRGALTVLLFCVIFQATACAKSADVSGALSARDIHWEERDSRPCEYVIAIDQSGSMEGTLDARNAAAAALVNSLPYENTYCSLLFFTYEEKSGSSGMLDISRRENRDFLTAHISEATEAYGEQTNLKLMMRNSIRRFSDYDSASQRLENSARHVIYMITDGESGGTGNPDANRTSQREFEEICRDYCQSVHLYIVYISQNADNLNALCDGLNTIPVTLSENAYDSDLSGHLSHFSPGEAAKVISIADSSRLELALTVLRYSEADYLTVRTVEKDSSVLFELPLKASGISIALTGGKTVESTLKNLSCSEGDLNRSAFIRPEQTNPSVVSLLRPEGFPAATYTLNLAATSPVSAVISAHYNDTPTYALEELDDPSKIPVNMPVRLRMSIPDAQSDSGNDSLSINIYARSGDSSFQFLQTARNGENFTLPDVPGDLRLRPSINNRELNAYWEASAVGIPLTIPRRSVTNITFFPSGKPVFLAHIRNLVEGPLFSGRNLRFTLANPEEGDALLQEPDGNGVETLYFLRGNRPHLFPHTYRLSVLVSDAAGHTAESDWTVKTHTILFWLLAALLALYVVSLPKKRHRKKRNTRTLARAQGITETPPRTPQETSPMKGLDAQLKKERELFQRETGLNQEFIRAGLRWRIRRGEEYFLGGLGLTDERGYPRKGCDLRQATVYYLNAGECESETPEVTRRANPLPFGLWKYSPEQNLTELTLMETDTMHSEAAEGQQMSFRTYSVGKNLVTFDGEKPCTYHIYGVGKEDGKRGPARITLTANNLTAEFELEYYADTPPFYL